MCPTFEARHRCFNIGIGYRQRVCDRFCCLGEASLL